MADRKRGISIPRGAYCTHYYYYREKVRYAEQVERFLSAFGRERVHIILFDDFVENTPSSYREALEFLGVDPEHRISFEVFNPVRRLRLRPIKKLMTDHHLLRAARRFIPALLRDVGYRFLVDINTGAVPPPPLSGPLRRRLQNELQGELVCLAELLNRDLSSWMRD